MVALAASLLTSSSQQRCVMPESVNLTRQFSRPTSAIHRRCGNIRSLAAQARRFLPIAQGAIDPDALTDASVSLSQLQQQLEDAIENEDYGAAAELRDEIERRRFDNRLAVEEANEAFYAAFQSGSLKDMSAIWGAGAHVQCIHPAAGCIAGRQSVLESWKLILGSGRLKIKLDDVRIYATEIQGYVTCVEVMDAGDSQGRVMATNIFEKQSGKWKIVHHHGSPLPRLS